MAKEIELKLELRADAADVFESCALLAASPVKNKQTSIYYDTTDLSLLKAGVSLRIRRSGSRRVQTVKAKGASTAGLFTRNEWEHAVKSDAPILDESTPIRSILGERADSLRPVFEVHVERRTWLLNMNAATIELVIDRGKIIAGDRESPFCEIELELKKGEPAVLFAVAREIGAAAPVRIGVYSKAQRGYQLRGPVIEVFLAEPVALHCEMTAAQAFVAIAQTCIRQFRLNETLLLEGRESEPMHQARVALRRLRSAFSIFRVFLMGPQVTHLRQELQWLAVELGDARNLDVILERSIVGQLHDRLVVAREKGYVRADAALASARARAMMLDLAEWIAVGDWLKMADTEALRSRPSRECATEALDRFRKRVKKSGHDLAALNDDARHEIRKDAKKLRYAADFFEALFSNGGQIRQHKRFIKTLKVFQDHLGALTDLATIPVVIDHLGLRSDPEAASLLAGNEKKKALLEAAVDAHRKFVDAKSFWR